MMVIVVWSPPYLYCYIIVLVFQRQMHIGVEGIEASDVDTDGNTIMSPTASAVKVKRKSSRLFELVALAAGTHTTLSIHRVTLLGVSFVDVLAYIGSCICVSSVQEKRRKFLGECGCPSLKSVCCGIWPISGFASCTFC